VLVVLPVVQLLQPVGQVCKAHIADSFNSCCSVSMTPLAVVRRSTCSLMQAAILCSTCLSAASASAGFFLFLLLLLLLLLLLSLLVGLSAARLVVSCLCCMCACRRPCCC
jgi:hypothetical protein